LLAQIAREGLVREVVARMTADFAANLDRLLSGTTSESSAKSAAELNGLSLLAGVLRQRAAKIFRRVRRRRRRDEI
jgi:aerobic carbon-monoxide dehydrogenase small subunit